MDDTSLEDEAQKLRSAYVRRGSPELRLADNVGQQLIVQERDTHIRGIFRQFGMVEHMLDLGCGDGSVVGALVAEGCARSAVGLDLLPERIDLARVAYPGIEFVVGDGSRLPFDDDSFDVVLAMTVFSSIGNRSHRLAALAEARRVLKPGGRFVWYDMRRANPKNPDVWPFSVDDVRAVFGPGVGYRTLTLVPPLARRLGRLTRILYPALAAIPLLRTHTTGWARVEQS